MGTPFDSNGVLRRLQHRTHRKGRVFHVRLIFPHPSFPASHDLGSKDKTDFFPLYSAPALILNISIMTILLTSAEFILWRISKLGPLTYMGLQILTLKIWMICLLILANVPSEKDKESSKEGRHGMRDVVMVPSLETCVVAM